MEREREGFCVWLTGLSGSGKSTIAQALEAQLRAMGHEVTLLDGDVVRTHLSKGLGFSREDRNTNVLRVGFVASEIVRHRGAVICALISPYAEARNQVRSMVGEGHFVLAFVDTPLAVCQQRDPKGLYGKARRGEVTNLSGVGDPYEVPADPDLALSTVECSPEANARRIAAHLRARGLLDTGPDAPAARHPHATVSANP